MTNIPDSPVADLPDTDLRSLFAAVQPTADFEDRLVTAVREKALGEPGRPRPGIWKLNILNLRQRNRNPRGNRGGDAPALPGYSRLSIPAPVKRAAIAAAAVLMVGVTGYVGNRIMLGSMMPVRAASADAEAHPSANGKIEKRDLMIISINDQSGSAKEIIKPTRVDQNGNISLPQLGLVKAEGLTLEGLQTLIADEYRDRQIIKNPEVNITVTESVNHQSAARQERGQTPFSPSVSTGTVTTRTNGASPYDNLDSVLLPCASQNDTPAPTVGPTPSADKKVAVPGITARQERGQTPLSGSELPVAGQQARDWHESAHTTLQQQAPREARYAQDREKTLEGLVQDARDFIDVGKYTEGLAVVDNIQRLDPKNAYAGDVRQYLEDKADNQRGREQQGHFNTEFTHQLNDAKQTPASEAAQLAAPKPADALGIASGKSFHLDAKGTNHAVNDTTTPQIVSGTLQLPAVDLKVRNSTDNTVRVDANGNPAAAKDWIANVGETIAANPADGLPSPQKSGVAQTLDLTAVAQAPNPVPAVSPAPVVAHAPAVDDRKIIRTGSMEFDVDRFDTAQMQITKIVGELGGFVGATDSQKLPNGKVRGSISVRVAPERLDVLVLSLRALGDLKSQQITAADITKEYTDIQSELAADRAMQDRLLELIHDGKGSVKDLLAAENELGTWRTKIEKAEGMIRYYNGQVALSTLSITMTERDIQTPATAVETETADVGIEADDVEKARNSALKAIDDVKGRIVEAELKRFDAGQLAARLVADVPPESAGAVIDQLKQLGKVARLEIHRQETNGKDGEVAASAPSGAAPLHTERKPTRLLISIYNLANVAPRRTTNVSLAAADVESAYTALVAATKSSGGRVVTSALDRGDPVKATGSLVLEFPPDKFDSALATLHAQGEVLNLNLIENPDTQNSTEAKAGLTVKLVSLANVAPRRTNNVSLAANDVSSAYAALVNITKSSGGRVVNSTLDQGDPAKATGALMLELPPEKLDAAITTLHAQGEVLNLNLAESRDTQNSTDAKVGLTVKLISMATVKPLETVQQTLAAADVPAAYQAVLTAASVARARVQSASLNEQDRQNITGQIDVEVPRANAGEFDKTLNAAGGTISRTSARLADTDGAVDSKVLVRLTITSAEHLAPRETTKLLMEVADVDKAAASAQAAAIASGGRVLVSKVSKDHGQGVAWVGLDFPLSKSGEMLQQVRDAGTVRGIDSSRDPQAPSGPMAHAYIEVEFRTADAIVADQTGPWASVRQGLSTSIHGLLLSLQWIVVGLCLIGPWAGIGWVGWKVFKRRKATA